MHSLLGLAGLLGLVAYAFGARSAVALAQVIIIGSIILLAVITVCVVTGQFKGL